MEVLVEPIPVAVVAVVLGATAWVEQGARVLWSFVTPTHKPLTITIT